MANKQSHCSIMCAIWRQPAPKPWKNPSAAGAWKLYGPTWSFVR